MSNRPSTCRWGVMGTANIARKVVPAMHLAPTAAPVAIASRNLDRAMAFADETGLERAHGSYEAMLSDPEIDAIYVPLPTAQRRDVILSAARAGKHVLCEKPVAPSTSAAEELIEACSDAGVQFMDGVMFMHHRRLDVLRLKIEELGLVPNLVESAFTFKGDRNFLKRNIRTSAETEPLGCVGDLGWYNVRIALIVMGDLPRTVRARHHETINGVPVHTSGDLEFDGPEGKRIVRFQCSFLHPLRQWLEIVADDACIRMNDFVLPQDGIAELEISSESRLDDRSSELEKSRISQIGSRIAKRILSKTLRSESGTSEKILIENCNQEAEMIECFSMIAAGINPIDPQWPRWALDTQRVTDAIMSSAGADGSTIELVG